MSIDNTINSIEKYILSQKEQHGAPPDFVKKLYSGRDEKNRRDGLASSSSAETLVDGSALERRKLASSGRIADVSQAFEAHCKVVQQWQQMYQKIKQKGITPSHEFIKQYNECVVSLNAKSEERYPEFKLFLQLKPFEFVSKDADSSQPYTHVQISEVKDRSQPSERKSTGNSWGFDSSLRSMWDTLKPIANALKGLSTKKLALLMSLPLLIPMTEARRIDGQNYTLDISQIERYTLPWPLDKLEVERRSPNLNASLDPLAQNLNTTFEQIMRWTGKECTIIPERTSRRPPTARQLKRWREKQCTIIHLNFDPALNERAKVFPKEKRILLNPEKFGGIEKPIQTYEQWLDTAQGTFASQLEHLFQEYPQLQGGNFTRDAFKNVTGLTVSDQFQKQERDIYKAYWIIQTLVLAVPPLLIPLVDWVAIDGRDRAAQAARAAVLAAEPWLQEAQEVLAAALPRLQIPHPVNPRM